MESLKATFHRIARVSSERSRTSTATENSQTSRKPTETPCQRCDDAGWVLTGARDRDDFPETFTCLSCEKGVELWRRTAGLEPGEKIPTLLDFDVAIQPDPKNAIASAKARSGAFAWAEGRAGNLVLSGPVGVGKSHLAKAALWHAARAQVRGLYLTMARFDHLSKDFEAPPHVRERRREALFNVPRLVIDDVGSGNREGSAFVKERLAEMFDSRYRLGLPALLTTNLSAEELASEVGVRSWDRLRANGLVIYMPGISMRRSGK